MNLKFHERLIRGQTRLYGLTVAVLVGFAGTSSVTLAQSEGESESKSSIDLLTNEEAWQLLPVEPIEAGAELPIWARATAQSLPDTTVAMLQLDYLHRADSPLDPITRSKLRWVAAVANHAEYSQRQALSDMRSAGLSAEEIEALVRDQRSDIEAEQHAIEFVRKLTISGSSVTDEEVAQLIENYGEQQVVAIVMLTAYSNFLDRLMHSLQISDFDGEPTAPLAIQPKADLTDRYAAPERDPVVELGAVNDPSQSHIPEQWDEKKFDTLQDLMNQQSLRTSRIRVPTFAEIAEEQGINPNRPEVKVKWTLVCMGYQPQLGSAWFQCMGTFGRESRQDRVFEESLFWVVTRTIDCFY